MSTKTEFYICYFFFLNIIRLKGVENNTIKLKLKILIQKRPENKQKTVEEISTHTLRKIKDWPTLIYLHRIGSYNRANMF